MVLTGPDVSRHQGEVDWPRVAGHGHHFAIIKATEGVSYSYTGWFRENWRELRGTDMVPGAYHFLRTSDGAAQARYFVSVVGGFDGALAVVDVETAANGSKPGITQVREFAAEFKRLVPNHPLLVYTGRWYWVGEIGNPRGVDIGPLWHSEYESSSASGPDLDNYGGWPAATIWQWTSTGRCPGVSGNCDLNVFYGSRADLLRLTGSRAPQPEPEPELQGVPDMAFTYGTTGRPTYFCDGGKSAGLNERTDLESIRKAFETADLKLPHLNLDGDTYNAFRKSFPGD